MVELTLAVERGAVDRALDAEFKALARRVRLATERVGRAEFLMPLRDDTRRAFASKKLPTSWRGRVEPQQDRPTLHPAYFVWSEAPQVMLAFEHGAEITANHRRFLAIPTIEAGRNAGGFMRKRLTPEIWARKNKTALVFRPTPYGGVLISELDRFKTRPRGRKRAKWVVFRRQKPIVVFILLKRVRLSKRLNISSIAERAGAIYRSAYERAANSQ